MNSIDGFFVFIIDGKMMTTIEIKEFYNDTKDSFSKLIETPISWVILRKEDVIKIKKPVQTSFLDFSTLDKRKYFCQREVVLNSRCAPKVYLGVVTISHQNKWVINNCRNKVEEYGVLMRRLNQNYFLPTILKNHKLSQKHILKLANKIVEFHARAVKYYEIEPEPINIRFRDIESIANQLKKGAFEGLNKIIEAAIEYSEQVYTYLEPVIEKRLHQGKFRDVHGDLHAGNIFMYPDPILFDCIEYNDDFRIIDVLDDMAFLCMDLDKYGYESFSSLLLLHYLNLSKEDMDEDVHFLFLYYKMYRANVRAKVIASKSKLSSNDQKDLFAYIDLMEKYKNQMIHSIPLLEN